MNVIPLILTAAVTISTSQLAPGRQAGRWMGVDGIGRGVAESECIVPSRHGSYQNSHEIAEVLRILKANAC